MICFSGESAQAFLLSCYSAHAMKILNEKWIPKLPCGNIARDGKPRNSGPFGSHKYGDLKCKKCKISHM
jgi:hypothetical protein